jgi:hypothetical protein
MEWQATTTKAGAVRKRIMWTNQMNKDIRCYMRCTKVETELTAYRQKMYTQFVEIYPETAERLSEQNVADRRRAIITQKMLTEIEINEIKNQVKQELQQEQTIQVDLVKPTENEEINQVKNQQDTRNQLTSQNESIINTNEDVLTKLKENLDTVITEFTGTDPVSRHKIPKPKMGPKLTHILEFLNKDTLPKYLKECHKLEDIHFITHCSALATVRTLGLKTNPLKQTKDIQNKKAPKWMHRLETRITKLGKEIGQLQQYRQLNRTNKLIKNVSKIVNPLRTENVNNDRLIELTDTRIQKLSLYSKRLRRYKENTTRKNQNR